MNDLELYRIKIEEIDSKMAKLFEERMYVVSKVLEYKKNNNLPILDQDRENKLIDKNLDLVSKDLEVYYLDFLKAIIEISKDYQKDLYE